MRMSEEKQVYGWEVGGEAEENEDCGYWSLGGGIEWGLCSALF